MKYTRLSLVYPAAYLLLGGLAAMGFPNWLTHFFLSPFSYPEVAVRFVGVLTFALGFIVVLAWYQQMEALYSPILWMRLFVGAWLLVFYFSEKDIMFLVMFVVGGVGVILSLASLFLDKNKQPYEIN